jgi:hypothetical protein
MSVGHSAMSGLANPWQLPGGPLGLLRTRHEGDARPETAANQGRRRETENHEKPSESPERSTDARNGKDRSGDHDDQQDAEPTTPESAPFRRRLIVERMPHGPTLTAGQSDCDTRVSDSARPSASPDRQSAARRRRCLTSTRAESVRPRPGLRQTKARQLRAGQDSNQARATAADALVRVRCSPIASWARRDSTNAHLTLRTGARITRLLHCGRFG